MSTKRNGSSQPTATAQDPGTLSHLREAQEHLSAAAGKVAEGVAVANMAAAQALRDGVDDSGPELRAAGAAASRAGRSVWSAGEAQFDAVRAQSRVLLYRSTTFVRERPVAAFGIAVASGFLLSRLLRR